MKLTKKHIGQLFDNDADGSWVYQLVGVNKKGWLLFWSFCNSDYVVCTSHTDWVPFKARKGSWPFIARHKKQGWKNPRYGFKEC